MIETIVDKNKSTVEPVASRVDPSWKGVYRVGGVCLFLVGLIYLTEVTLGIYGEYLERQTACTICRVSPLTQALRE